MKIIDFEHHFFHKDFLSYLRSRTEYPLIDKNNALYFREGGMQPIYLKGENETTYEQEVKDLDDLRLTIMDKAGIACGCISSSGGIEALSREKAVKYAQMTNDAVADVCRRHPGRFLGTACLPACYVEESLKELERCVKELGFKYWHTHSNYVNEYLFQKKFEPILAKCAELGVAFYLHPLNPSTSYLSSYGAGVSGAGFGFGVDTMRTAILLIQDGIFDRYPNLKMILGHMGEFFPYCLARMDNRFFLGRELSSEIKCKGGFTNYFKNGNIFVTTSGIFDPRVALFAIQTIGIDNILFGSDYPYENVKASADFIRNLPIGDEDKEKIAHLNAEKYIL